MGTFLILFALAAVIAVGATAAVRTAGLRFGVVDRPDGFRKVHREGVPCLGGVAVFAAFACALLAWWVSDSLGLGAPPARSMRNVFGLLLGAAVVLVTGIRDDVWGLRPRWKLLLQAVAGAVVVAAGFSISGLASPFGGTVSLGGLGVPLSWLWLLGCMNAVNLLDGLDGLAAGVCLLACGTFLAAGIVLDDPLCMVLSVCLGGALLGFLAFNAPPASVFLGDCGSLVLGLLVGAMSLRPMAKAAGTATQFLPVVALALPLFDTALAVLRRWSRRLPLSAAGRQHIHHVLLDRGLSHRQAVVTLHGVCALCCGAALLLIRNEPLTTLLVLGGLGAAGLAWARRLGALRLAGLWRRISEDLGRRHRSKEARAAVERVLAGLRSARTLDDAWAATSQAVRDLGFDSATMCLFRPSAALPAVFAWTDDARTAQDEQDGDAWSARLRIYGGDSVFGELEVSKASRNGPPPAVAPELLDRVRRQLAGQIAAIAETDAAPADHTAAAPPSLEPSFANEPYLPPDNPVAAAPGDLL